jgi:hypothetical protein
VKLHMLTDTEIWSRVFNGAEPASLIPLLEKRLANTQAACRTRETLLVLHKQLFG